MPKPFKPGCKRPEVSVNMAAPEEPKEESAVKEMRKMIKVGQKAPDFELAGYLNGEFSTFRLSEYAGKWVLLCFYPGDFTFV